MTELELGDAIPQPVPLDLDRRVTLGSANRAPREQHDRVSLGRPRCVALDLATVGADARDFLEERSESSFWLLALTCSFRAVDDEPIEKAWLEVRLRTETPGDGLEPAAWSMEPLSLSSPLQVSKVAKLDASLKLTSDLIPVEIGPAASVQRTQEHEEQVPYLEAYREGTACPSWIFTRTSINEIRGVHRLRAVVELPTGATGRAEASVGATLRLKLLGLISYRANLHDLPEHQSVVLGG